MPISLEPNQTFEIVLESDAAKPRESRPTFLVRSQTMRGHLKILQVIERKADRTLTTEQYFEEICEAINSVLVGWRNMGQHVFGGTMLQDLLSYSEANELLTKVAYNAHVDPDEKKD